MTQQLPLPTGPLELMMHLAQDHPYQNKSFLEQGLNTTEIYVNWLQYFLELAERFCSEDCEPHEQDPDAACNLRARETMRLFHENAHGIGLVQIGNDYCCFSLDTDTAPIIYSNDAERVKVVNELTNAHHTHTSAVSDTVDELLGNL